MLHTQRTLTRLRRAAFRKLRRQAFREYSKIDRPTRIYTQQCTLARFTLRHDSKFETKAIRSHRIRPESLWKVSSAQSYWDRELGLYATRARQPRGAQMWTGAAVDRAPPPSAAPRTDTGTPTPTPTHTHTRAHHKHSLATRTAHTHSIRNW